MEIRFEAHGNDRLAKHARQELLSRLMDRREHIAHVTIRVGATGRRRRLQDTYCVMHLQVRGVPAATVVDIGSDAQGTIERAADRVSRLAEEQLRLATARRGTARAGSALSGRGPA